MSKRELTDAELIMRGLDATRRTRLYLRGKEVTPEEFAKTIKLLGAKEIDYAAHTKREEELDEEAWYADDVPWWVVPAVALAFALLLIIVMLAAVYK